MLLTQAKVNHPHRAAADGAGGAPATGLGRTVLGYRSAPVVDRLSKGNQPDIRLWFMKSQHEIRERLAEKPEDLNGYTTEDRDKRYEWVRGYAEALEWVLLGEGEVIAIG